MLIALATQRDLPDWEMDDQPLHRALEARGVTVLRPAWDDPEFRWAAVDACLIRTTWDYAERHREFVAWAERAQRETALFHPAPVVRWNTHKRYLRDLEEAGVPVVPTEWLRPGDPVDLGRRLDARGWDRAFFKPAVGSTARETRRFDRSESSLTSAAAHLAALLEQGETMLLQPYLESVEEHGEVSVLRIGGATPRGVRKIPVPGDYRVQDDFGARDEPFDPPTALLRSAERAFDTASQRTGVDLLYGRADFLLGDDGSYRLNELEVVEPSLFFRHDPQSADALAEALLARLRDA